jgi:outer membrane protein OmpA-like peptidoglycan-associated protein
MGDRAKLKKTMLSFLFLGLPILFSQTSLAATTPTMIIEEAKVAIEEARKAGADRVALDDFMAAKSWLSQAEKEYEARKSLLARTKRIVSSDQEKEEEIIYLGTVAKLKAMTAEAKAKTDTTLVQLRQAQRELGDYQDAIEILKKKLAEGEKAKEAQAKAEEERKALEEAKQKTADLEDQKKRELEEARMRASELEALKQKELQASRLEEATRVSQRERELSEAKLRTEQLAEQQAKEAAELKAWEEKLATEREKIAAIQKKAEALEEEKAMLAEASKIPQATARSGDKEVVITILAINLFTPNIEITTPGKQILDNLGTFLNRYPDHKVSVRGHTDSVGSEAMNKTVSEKRAQKVREYLVAYQNVNPTQITALGMGPSQPVATNATEAGRALNRRVEIAVMTEK